MDIDQELINILCSCSNAKQLCDTIEILKDQCVLSKSELNLFKDFTKDIETYGSTNVESKFKDCEEIQKYNSLELDDKIGVYVKERYDREFVGFFDADNMYLPEKVNYYFTGYTKQINTTIDENIFSDDMFCSCNDNIISTNSTDIDEYSGGIKHGYITTLIGDEGAFKSLWAINIAYTAILNANNVMYLSLGVNKDSIAKRLMTRHSCNERFSNGMSYEEMHNPYNFNRVSNIINDFEDNYSKNIILYDESDLKIASVASLRRLIALAQKHFLDVTAAGIDLIVIDDFSYMSLSKSGKITRNRSSVINEYYHYLKGEANNILGTGCTCSVVCTHQHKGDGHEVYFNNGEYRLSYIPEPIVLCSDNIFTIYGSTLENTKASRCKVVKTSYGEVMEYSIKVAVDSDKWYMSFDDKSITESRELCKFKDEQITDLKQQVVQLAEQRNNQAKALEQYRRQEDDDMDILLGKGLLSDKEVNQLRKQNPIDHDEDGKDDGKKEIVCISMCS